MTLWQRAVSNLLSNHFVPFIFHCEIGETKQKIHTYTHMWVRISVCVWLHIYTYIHTVYIYTHIYTCTCMYVYFLYEALETWINVTLLSYYFGFFKKVASGVNLLESLGIHFIILINPDNLRTHTIFMELGQVLVRHLFLHYISIPGFKIKRKC